MELSTDPTDARPPLPFITYYALPYLAIALVMALRPSLTWRFSAVAALVSVMLRGTRFDAGSAAQNYSIVSALGSVSFTAVKLLLLSDPVRECRHEMQTEPMVEMPLWRRVYWAFCVEVNTRGIGWNYQVRTLFGLEESLTRLSW